MRNALSRTCRHFHSTCDFHSPLQLCWVLLAVCRNTNLYWVFYWQTSRNTLQMFFFFWFLPSSIHIYVSHLFFRDLLPKESSAIWLFVSSIDCIFDAVYQENFQCSQFTSPVLPCFHFIRCLCLQLFLVVGFSSFICWVTFVCLLNLAGCTSCEESSLT